MKLNKYTKTAIVFTIGASVFVTTAFADMLLGSGYDKFKQTIKTTAKMLDKDFNSYTLISNAELKLDGELLHHTHDMQKIDSTNKKQLNLSTTTNFLDDEKSYTSESYSDTEYRLYKDGDGEYYGHRIMSGSDDFYLTNYADIYEGEYTSEVEKVIDAAVGSMKNLVQHDSLPDGSFQYNGELTATQVPALYNALLSLVAKEGFSYELRGSALNQDATDVYIANIAGTATQHADGYLTSIEGSMDIAFKGDDKKEQILQIVISSELKDINSTVVERPVFDEDSISEVYENYSFIDPKYVGTYKNNIVIENDSELIKIGERVLTISSLENGQISGTYEQIIDVNSQDENYKSFKYEFIETTHEMASNLIEYKNVDTGETGFATLDTGAVDSIYFEYNVTVHEDEQYIEYNYDEQLSPYYNSEMKRVFE